MKLDSDYISGGIIVLFILTLLPVYVEVFWKYPLQVLGVVGGLFLVAWIIMIID